MMHMAERRLLAQRKAAAQPAGLVFGISSASTKTASIRAPRQQLVITSAVSRRQAVYYRRFDELPRNAAAREPAAVAPAAPSTLGEAAARPRIVILGSGWASMSLVQALPANITEVFDIVLVSPRNYFLYTPLLPAVAAGSMEERSIVQPVRNIMHNKGRYYEAVCSKIDPVNKEITACYPFGQANCFQLPYDMLIIGIGSVNNTFGVPGVWEHCHFLKCLEDAHNLRTRVTECFERAALPNASEEERARLLSFVVCGGGPTGVEVAAELHDMMHHDLKNLFPGLMQYVKIRVVEMLDHVLATYNPRAGEYTEKLWKREGIELLLRSRVLGVTEQSVKVADKDGREADIPFGACVWSTGIGMHPLVNQLKAAFPAVQTHNRCVLTDEFFRVEGSDGSIFVMGDAATIHTSLASEHVDELFESADTDEDGLLTVGQLQKLLHDAEKEFPHLAKHARFLDGKQNRFTSLIGPLAVGAASSSALADLDMKGKLSREQFRALLQDMDSSVRALPATAQVAKQAGEFVADVLQKNAFEPEVGTVKLNGKQKPFKYFHKGSLAYVGSDRAIMDVPVVGAITGPEAGLAWRGYETLAQISPRNAMLVLQNFVRTKLFGRDLSNV